MPRKRRRLRVPRANVEDPLNLIQVMLAKGSTETAFSQSLSRMTLLAEVRAAPRANGALVNASVLGTPPE